MFKRRKSRNFATMNETVTDLLNMIAGLSAEMVSLRKTVDELRRENLVLERENEALKLENKNLREKLRKYERQAKENRGNMGNGQNVTKNSSNSSVPPSKENMGAEVIRRTQTLREPSGRKPGGQVGHVGSTLGMSDAPDKVVHDVALYCTKCQHDLSDSEPVLEYISQVISLPELKPVVTEIWHYVRTCKECGEQVRSYKKRKRGGNLVTYDNSVKTLAVYMSVVLFLPYGRIENFFKEVLNINCSQGSIDNWIREALKKAEPSIERIKQAIMECRVVGFDESGCYCNKRLDWAWIAQTVYFTLLFRADGRSSKELEKRFGDSLDRMIAVTDRHNAYFVINFLDHQVCLTHLLRNLKYLGELNGEQEWSKKVEKLLQEAIHERNENLDKVIDKKPFIDRLDELLSISLEHLEKDFEAMRKGLEKCKDYLFNFLEDPEIPSDNNASERGIRKLKIKLKNSCIFRSELGADAFLGLFSIVDTVRKHQQNPHAAISALFEAENLAVAIG